uniref:Phosphatidylinositol transfer protein N-terminal domain-containing protein n=1 Tax=Astyanax mexicanus TaxID=7994 RepID=A0A8B9JV07_ASTMX
MLVGQLYTISKHSHQESDTGEGVEVLRSETHCDPKLGQGHFSEKRLHLASKLPSWARSFIPRIFYITEKARNYYPYTVTGEDLVLMIHIHVILVIYIYSTTTLLYLLFRQDLKRFSSMKTGRGPLQTGWWKKSRPVMCSYKLVRVQFEVFGLQSRVEQYIHKVIRDVLLVGHRQAFAWVDEWYCKSHSGAVSQTGLKPSTRLNFPFTGKSPFKMLYRTRTRIRPNPCLENCPNCLLGCSSVVYITTSQNIMPTDKEKNH